MERATRVFRHTIIEAHPDVYAHARGAGWCERDSVEWLQGRWQDVLPALAAAGKTFDAIFFDTYAESYTDMRTFFQLLPELLRDERSIASYFNGLAADNAFFHAVYCRFSNSLSASAPAISSSAHPVPASHLLPPSPAFPSQIPSHLLQDCPARCV